MRIDSEQIIADVRANLAKLASCAGPHSFTEPVEPDKPWRRWRCPVCGGTVDSIAKSWYERGLAHGKVATTVG